MSHRIVRIVPAGTRIGPDSGLPATTPGVWTLDLVVQSALVGGSASFVMLHFTGAVFGPGAVVTVDLGYDVDQFGSVSGAEFWTRPLDPERFGQTVRVTFSGPAGGVTLLEYGSLDDAPNPLFRTLTSATRDASMSMRDEMESHYGPSASMAPKITGMKV